MSSSRSTDSITQTPSSSKRIKALAADLSSLTDEQVRELRRELRRKGGVGLIVGAGASVAAPPQPLNLKLARLVETLTPDVEIPSEAAVILSRRNAQRRAELLTEFGALTSEQVAEGRSAARNRHALATRWRKEGKIFGLPYRGQTVFPAFQFDDDGVRPAIQSTLSALPTSEMTEWEVGFWWTAPNGWLHDQRPVDLLDGNEQDLIDAANHLANPPPL